MTEKLIENQNSDDFHEYPIRLIVGIGNNMVQGFLVVYERKDGSAGWANVWSDKFSNIEFVDNDQNSVIFKREEVGVLRSKHEFRLHKIHLSRKSGVSYALK